MDKSIRQLIADECDAALERERAEAQAEEERKATQRLFAAKNKADIKRHLMIRGGKGD